MREGCRGEKRVYPKQAHIYLPFNEFTCFSVALQFYEATEIFSRRASLTAFSTFYGPEDLCQAGWGIIQSYSGRLFLPLRSAGTLSSKFGKAENWEGKGFSPVF